MTFMMRILHLIPGQLLERMYHSKFNHILISMYDYLSKDENLKVHRICGDILMEIDLSKMGERALPFNAFEPAITQKFLEIVKDGDVVFDVGAWIGYYTLLASKKAKKVVAIEADKTNYQRIRRNVDLNNFSNVTILNTAVGDELSQGVLVEGLDSSMYKVVAHGEGKIIKIESLDNIINKLNIAQINLLIMDIEGYEYFGLKGLEKSLSARIVRNLICEIHPILLKENGLSDKDVLNLLSEHEYEIGQLHKTISSKINYHIYARPKD